MTYLDCLSCNGIYKIIFDRIFFIFVGIIAIGNPFKFISGLIILFSCLKVLYLLSRSKNKNQPNPFSFQVIVKEVDDIV